MAWVVEDILGLCPRNPWAEAEGALAGASVVVSAEASAVAAIEASEVVATSETVATVVKEAVAMAGHAEATVAATVAVTEAATEVATVMALGVLRQTPPVVQVSVAAATVDVAGVTVGISLVPGVGMTPAMAAAAHMTIDLAAAAAAVTATEETTAEPAATWSPFDRERMVGIATATETMTGPLAATTTANVDTTAVAMKIQGNCAVIKGAVLDPAGSFYYPHRSHKDSVVPLPLFPDMEGKVPGQEDPQRMFLLYRPGTMATKVLRQGPSDHSRGFAYDIIRRDMFLGITRDKSNHITAFTTYYQSRPAEERRAIA